VSCVPGQEHCLHYLPACLCRAFAAWRRAAARAAELARLGQLCSAAHARLIKRGCLSAWRARAAGKSAKRQQMEQAAERWTQRCRKLALEVWRRWASEKLGRRRAGEQAASHHAQRCARLVLRCWRQLTRCAGLSQARCTRKFRLAIYQGELLVEGRWCLYQLPFGVTLDRRPLVGLLWRPGLKPSSVPCSLLRICSQHGASKSLHSFLAGMQAAAAVSVLV
jgi:hypothetical protein